MEKQLKPGDKIKWYRDTTPVPGTILKVTPKRVKIETIGNDGRPTAHYVSPKSVGIAPSNEPQLPPQARKKDKQQGIDPFSAKSTLLWQTLAGLLCLGAGGSLISLLILWANQWGLYYSDHSKHDFLPGAIYVAISVLILTGYITKKQFDEAIAIGDIFRSSIRTFLWGWACFMACYSIMLLAILLIGGSFLIVAVEIALWFMSFIMFGVTIGTIQYFRLKLEGFDQAKHLQFLSPEADLAACKAGVLPYQVRVRAFWPIMVITFFSLLSLTGWLMIIPTDDGEIEDSVQ